MDKNEKTKNVLLIILLISLISLSIAYAVLTQYLYINSQTTVGGASGGWKVEFTSASCQAVGNASIIHDFNFDSTNLTGLEYKFIAPGDSIICNITVANHGYISAKLSSFIMQDGQLNYLGSGTNQLADETLVNGKIQYSIVYAQGDARAGQVPATNDPLPAGTSRNLVLTATYPGTADLPHKDVVVSGFKTTFLYVQD